MQFESAKGEKFELKIAKYFKWILRFLEVNTLALHWKAM